MARRPTHRDKLVAQAGSAHGRKAADKPRTAAKRPRAAGKSERQKHGSTRIALQVLPASPVIEGRALSQKGQTENAVTHSREAKPVIKYPETAFQPWPARMLAGLRKTAAGMAENQSAARALQFLSILVLAGSTVFWALLSAQIHRMNADQYIDAYLFESWETFQGAVFPGTHSFLLKWPLFALMALFGNTDSVFLVATVSVAFVTVLGFAWLLYLLNRQPLVHAWLCLALATVLLLVPIEPYGGALLPTNFGMTTTRNIEYLLLLVSVVCLLRAKQWRSPWLVAGMTSGVLLIATDKLFLPLLLGGVGFSVIVHFLQRRTVPLKSIRILAGAAMTVILGSLLLTLLNAVDITNISRDTASSPFQVTESLTGAANAVIYAVLGLLTNFGANPVHDVIVTGELPSAFIQRLLRLETFVYLAHLAVLAAGIWAAFRSVRSGDQTVAARFAVVLVGALLTALAIFVATDHYYPVDARYLTIGLFAVFVCLAVCLRRPRASGAYVG
ncbi:MAG TPA: hypothetical protein VK983_03115, partial [Candidatus Limnocylindrales bacterium]|nr:hypothetical protein [Candidatus Limnocylindrales bacterium]